MDLQNINALVFEGGGMKGIAHCGALFQLERYGLDLNHITSYAGTSAGSQIATLLACGYTIGELRYIVMNLPVDEFMDKSCGLLRNVSRLFCSYGIFKGDYMEKYIDDLVFKKLGKKKATFMDLYVQRLTLLRITGTCLSTSTLDYFDYNLTPDMPISKAVRISSSIPLFYSAVKYDNKYYVDGGVIRNLPIMAFPSVPTLFFRFKEQVPKEPSYEKHKHSITNIVKFLMSLLDVTIIHSNALAIEHGMEYNSPLSMTVVIDTKDVTGLDFDLDDKEKALLLLQGEHAVNQLLNKN